VSPLTTPSPAGRGNASTARGMWQLFEPVHAIIYFAEEPRQVAEDAGLLGYWMAYFAFRAAPLGEASRALVASTFYGFGPARIERALPDAWHRLSPDGALAARLAGADLSLRTVWNDDVASGAVTEAADLLWAAAQAADTAGRPLGATNQALPAPAAAHVRLWQAATTLREHRGDGHVAALVANDVGPVEAHLLKVAAGDAEAEPLRASRKWDDAVWEDARTRVLRRGWLSPDGRLAAPGVAIRRAVEEATDRAAAHPWQALGEERTERLADLLRPLVRRIVEAGVFPPGNPVGMPQPESIN
jgi:hypothetical protein